MPPTLTVLPPAAKDRSHAFSFVAVRSKDEHQARGAEVLGVAMAAANTAGSELMAAARYGRPSSPIDESYDSWADQVARSAHHIAVHEVLNATLPVADAFGVELINSLGSVNATVSRSVASGSTSKAGERPGTHRSASSLGWAPRGD